MLLMDYPSIRREDFTDFAKQANWNLFHACIDSHIQRLIEKYPGYGVQSITRMQYQCTNMIFSDKSRYNVLFQQVAHKGGESEINYIKRSQNDKALGF